MVENLQMARVIQYNLFQQKPVADYDKIRKNNYDLADVIAKCNLLFFPNKFLVTLNPILFEEREFFAQIFIDPGTLGVLLLLHILFHAI